MDLGGESERVHIDHDMSVRILWARGSVAHM